VEFTKSSICSTRAEPNLTLDLRMPVVDAVLLGPHLYLFEGNIYLDLKGVSKSNVLNEGKIFFKSIETVS